MVSSTLVVFILFLTMPSVCRVDFDNPEKRKMRDNLVALMERMLELNKRPKGALGQEGWKGRLRGWTERLMVWFISCMD